MNEEKDLKIVCSKIDEESEFLHTISNEIWKMPELRFKEVQAHAVLTCALRKRGFKVQKHYYMPTAFRAEFCSKEVGRGPTVSLLLEYDALPEIGHACGHNLIAEAGLAAALGVKAAMEADPELLQGKLVVLGCPAEEGGGGKIRLLELEAFEGVDAALMVHPATKTIFRPLFICNARYNVVFKGKEAHAAACPWEGLNALDAAVACYQGIGMLRQHIEPTSRIQAIISKGGVAANVIPSTAALEVCLRTETLAGLRRIRARVESVCRGAATGAGCEVELTCDEANVYEDLVTNRVLGELFAGYARKMGLQETHPNARIVAGSTDMGNVSHRVPSIHPLYAVPASGVNHSRPFAEAAGSPAAQHPTLCAAKALAMTALGLMRSPDTLERVKKAFRGDLAGGD